MGQNGVRKGRVQYEVFLKKWKNRNQVEELSQQYPHKWVKSNKGGKRIRL